MTSGSFSEKLDGAYHTGSFDQIEDLWVEEASLVLYSLSNGEGLVDLTIRWVDKVRSGRMTETLMRILWKLAMALETGLGRVLGRGRVLAARASELAVGWGNGSAFYWRFEQAFCNALGLGILG